MGVCAAHLLLLMSVFCFNISEPIIEEITQQFERNSSADGNVKFGTTVNWKVMLVHINCKVLEIKMICL